MWKDADTAYFRVLGMVSGLDFMLNVTRSRHRTGLRKASFLDVGLKQNHCGLMKNEGEGGDMDLRVMECAANGTDTDGSGTYMETEPRGSWELSVEVAEAEGTRCDSTFLTRTTNR